MIKKIAFILFAGLFVFFGIVPVFAQEEVKNTGLGLSVSPPIKEKTVTSGETYSDVIKISNTSAATINVDVNLQDFLAKGEEGGQEFIEAASDNSTYTMAKWITLDKKMTLKANETKEVNYTITVPKDAEPGGHYGVIFFTVTPEKPQTSSESGAVLQTKIGTLFLLTVSGQLQYGAKIAEFKTNKNIFTESKNTIDFLTRFQNLSSVHVKPTGTIEIKNALGTVVETMNVNETGSNVLPDSIRKFTNSWEKKYGFGPYKAAITLNYGEGQSISSIVSFWIIPWKETLGILVLIIILVWLLSNLSWKKNN